MDFIEHSKLTNRIDNNGNWRDNSKCDGKNTNMPSRLKVLHATELYQYREPSYRLVIQILFSYIIRIPVPK